MAFELLLRSWGLEFFDRDMVCFLVISSIDKQVMAVKFFDGFQSGGGSDDFVDRPETEVGQNNEGCKAIFIIWGVFREG